MGRGLRILAMLVMAAAWLPVTIVRADPYPVTSTSDSGSGSLRAAISAATGHPGFDTIPIEVTGAIGLQSTLPTINSELSIVGPGAESLTVRREAAPRFRIFYIGPEAKVALSGMTISNGVEEVGGGIFSDGALTLTRVVVVGNEAAPVPSNTQGLSASGGGIHNRTGTLTLHESTVRDNRVVAASVVDYAYTDGGGIYSYGPRTLDRSTVVDNVAESLAEPAGWSAADGGGLKVVNGPVTIERSTISGNSALAIGGKEQTARGGGIQGGGFTITSSTLTGNAVVAAETALGANLESSFGTTLVRNTIVADPQGDADSCDGPEGSGGFNIDEDGSCFFEMPSDLAGVVPGLDPVLRMNGGATPTHALLRGGAAIDQGNAFGFNVDQRGSDRPSDFGEVPDAEEGDGSDIGSFELQYSPPAPESPPSPLQGAPGAGAAADEAAPDTRIVRAPARVTFDRIAKFRFASTEPGSRFQCAVDGRRWRVCLTPYKQKVSRGARHVFRVRAIDGAGNVDPTPARFGWRVKPIA